jgi:uncharacterized SAM-binding protein YcdF (DUF218 family)
VHTRQESRSSIFATVAARLGAQPVFGGASEPKGGVGFNVAQKGGLAVLLVLLALVFTLLPNRLASHLVVPRRVVTADAIVVLGGGIQGPRTLASAAFERAGLDALIAVDGTDSANA